MSHDLSLMEKMDRLKSIIRTYRSVLVAYSGGVDSTLLLAVSSQVLNAGVTAVTVRHMAHTDREIRCAAELAQLLGVKHYLLDVTAASRPVFASNPDGRCYLCKRLIFEMLLAEARSNNIEAVLDGSQLEDAEDDRPGLKALAELGIAAPLREAGLSKREIRLISRQMGLSTHDKPARPCLATRFPSGEPIDEAKLRMVEAAEDYLAGLGLECCRVRSHRGEARIETIPQEMATLLDMETVAGLTQAFSVLGFSGIFLDLNGYRGRV